MNLIGNIMTFISDIVRQYPIKSFFLILSLIVLAWLGVWEPLSPLPAREWNVTNLKEINVADPTNFSFAVFGDNQNSKFVFDNLLRLVDHDPGITFAISLGNSVSRGNIEKYNYFIEQAKDNLGIPLLTTMGDRELKAGGPALYHEIFGPAYYSFHIGKNFFMVLDDASIEELDLMLKDGWIEKNLRDSQQYDTRLIFMHMPLYDPRRKEYNECLPEEYSERLMQVFLKYRVTHIFAAHIHGYLEGSWNGIPYTVTGGAGAKLRGTDPDHYFFHFLKVTINKGNVQVQVKPVPCPNYVWMDQLNYNLNYSYHYLSIHLFEIISIVIAAGLAALIYRSDSRKRKERTRP
jgi:serine/threonine-protein phosphatase CPPED1